MADANPFLFLDGFRMSTVQRFINVDSGDTKVPATIFALIVVGLLTLVHQFILDPLVYGKLSHVPGPKLAGLSWYYLSYFDLCLCRNEKISEWHDKYGPGLQPPTPQSDSSN